MSRCPVLSNPRISHFSPHNSSISQEFFFLTLSRSHSSESCATIRVSASRVTPPSGTRLPACVLKPCCLPGPPTRCARVFLVLLHSHSVLVSWPPSSAWILIYLRPADTASMLERVHCVSVCCSSQQDIHMWLGRTLKLTLLLEPVNICSLKPPLIFDSHDPA